MVNYIIACYSGKRRGYNSTPIELFVSRHLDYIKSSNSNITKVTFVINESISELDNLIIDIINKNDLDIPTTIILRDNIDGSYGAWEQALLETHKDTKYSFLIEDDYIPSRLDTIDYFLKVMNNNVAFVSSLWRENHSAISNGLFNNEMVEKTLSKHQHLFVLNRTSNNITQNKHYISLFQNQRRYLSNVEGIKNVDITNIGYTIYRSQNPPNIEFGNKSLPLLIHPI